MVERKRQSPEEVLVREIYEKDDKVNRAVAEEERVRQLREQTQDELDETIGAAETQLILMKSAANVTEEDKLQFAEWLYYATKELKVGSPRVVDVFRRLTPGAPIIAMIGNFHSAQIVASEAYASIRPAIGGKPGVDVGINCLTTTVNHDPTENTQNPFREYERSFNIRDLDKIHVGIPAIQTYLDSLPSKIPQQKQARQQHKEYLRSLKRSIEDLSTLGVEGVEELDTRRLNAQLSLLMDLELADYQATQPTYGRSGRGWWPRH